MKKYLVLSLIAFIFSANVKAQSDAEGEGKLLNAYRKKLALDQLQPKQKKITPPTISFPALDTPRQEEQIPSVLKLPLDGKYIGTNAKGDEIYAMQPDNMPCLVPGKAFKLNMPVAEGEGPYRSTPFKKNPDTESK